MLSSLLSVLVITGMWITLLCIRRSLGSEDLCFLMSSELHFRFVKRILQLDYLFGQNDMGASFDST